MMMELLRDDQDVDEAMLDTWAGITQMYLDEGEAVTIEPDTLGSNYGGLVVIYGKRSDHVG